MKLSRIGRLLLIAVGIFSILPLAFASKPTWARNAVAFPSQCEIGSSAPDNGSPRTALAPLHAAAPCRPIRIPSPDKKLTIDVKYQKVDIERGFNVLVAYLLLRAQDGTIREADIPYGFQDNDLLWSPDSKAFFVNGGNGGGYWGFWVYAYRIDDPALKPLDITSQAQRDMVKTFPPCMANWLDRKTCLAIEKDPDFNMSGIDWSSDSSSIIIMAEAPCSGDHGGIMCQVMGYEVNIPTGTIVRRMNSTEFARGWQKSMAFRFHDPGPPEYCDPKGRPTVRGCEGRDW